MTSFKPPTYQFEDFVYTGTKNQEGSHGKIIKPSFKAQLDNIPDELKLLDQWVVWSLVQKQGNEKSSKLPTRRVKGKPEIKNASLLYPVSYERAKSIYEDCPGIFAGVGFVFREDGPFVFIDLDGVIPGDKRNKYADTNTFVEFSQSGTGLHIICKGKIDKAHKPISGEVEIYSDNRFCAITGLLAGKKILEITDQQDLINTLIEEYPHDKSPSVQESTGFELPDIISEGSRNNVMWQYCCSLAHKNILEATMLSRALAANRDRCYPPLDEFIIREQMHRAQQLIETRRRERRDTADEVDLINRYALISTNAKYFDLINKSVKLREAIDAAHSDTHPGGANNPPRASTFINTSSDKYICDGLIWFPQPYESQKLFVEDEGLTLANTWKGFTTTPRKGDIQPWLNHLEYLFIDPVHRQNVIEWLAFMLQHPDIKCNWQLIVQGDEGAGKDALFLPIARILGSASNILGNRDVRGDFDDALVGAKFIIFSEARNIRDDAIEKIKRISASESNSMMLLNPKRKDMVSQLNLWALAIITNHTDAIKLSRTERRFYVLSSGDKVMSEEMIERYFKNWLNKPEALAALFHYLLEVNLDTFNPNTLPERTSHMSDMIEATNNDMESLLTDWNYLKIKSFSYDVIHPEWIKEDLAAHNVKYSLSFIKKWLRKNGWTKPCERPVKKINGKNQYKSTMFLVSKICDLVTLNPPDLFDEIEKVEKLVEAAAQEGYRNAKTA